MHTHTCRRQNSSKKRTLYLKFPCPLNAVLFILEHTVPWRWNSVPKRQHIKFRRRGITPNEEHNNERIVTIIFSYVYGLNWIVFGCSSVVGFANAVKQFRTKTRLLQSAPTDAARGRQLLTTSDAAVRFLCCPSNPVVFSHFDFIGSRLFLAQQYRTHILHPR
jgi:hypothetical protein